MKTRVSFAVAAGPPASSRHDARARRVIVLLLAVIVLSFADLVVTVGHLRSTGMIEANPIAAWIIENTNSSWLLGAYKLTTVGVCVMVLYRLRRHAEGEAAAWLAVGILAGLSFLWHFYSEEMDTPHRVMTAQYQEAERWLCLD